jgi:hypothetical protein
MKIQIYVVGAALVCLLSTSAVIAEDTAQALYRQECGDCHIAYPARFLPQQSWDLIMRDLSDHFGDSAELDKEDKRLIHNYMSDNCAEVSGPRNWLTGTFNQPVVKRITELPHFRHEHNEIPTQYLQNNPKVKSLSQCDSCHLDAKTGEFSEYRIRIPR